jgi:hypothetical protein
MRWEVWFSTGGLVFLSAVTIWATRGIAVTMRQPCPDHWFVAESPVTGDEPCLRCSYTAADLGDDVNGVWIGGLWCCPDCWPDLDESDVVWGNE